jgi:hypothetical protein
VGEAIQPRGTDMAALVALRAEAMDRIAEHCGEPRLDLVAAGPVREVPGPARVPPAGTSA